MNTSSLMELASPDLEAIAGGNFAYDVGRAIRFFVLAGPTGQYVGLAVADWMATDAANAH